MCTHATSDVDELLHRISSCEEREFGFKRRIGERHEWKDPYECMKRLEITRSDAIAIIKSLRKENLIKPVEEAKDDRHPSPKFVFKTKKPASLLAGKTLYIKLSSPDSCFKVYVDSFHEDKMPEECDEWRN